MHEISCHASRRCVTHIRLGVSLKCFSGSRIPIGIDRGFIKPPKDISQPIICVGPGTGIAPMRALIEERAKEGAKGTVFITMRDSHPLYPLRKHAILWLSFCHQGSALWRRMGGDAASRNTPL